MSTNVTQLLQAELKQRRAELQQKQAEVAALELAIEAMAMADTPAAHRPSTNGTASHPGVGRYGAPPLERTLAMIGRKGRNGLHTHVLNYFEQHRGEALHAIAVTAGLYPSLRMPRKERIVAAVGSAMVALARDGKLQWATPGRKTGHYILPA